MTAPLRLLLVLATASATCASASDAAGAPLHVLFIGNSLTSTNNLPAMVATLAKAGGHELVPGSQLVGGKALKYHWTEPKGAALAKINGQKWDWVVLQDYSSEAITAPADMVTYGTLFNDAVAKAGARTAWYMTWAYKDHQEQQPIITKGYTDLSATTKGTLVPAGVAWDAYRTAHPQENLFKDNKHPTAAGTYLVACVFYATFYHTTPVGLPGDAAKLDAAQAKAFQEVAWAAVQGGGADKAVAK